MTGSPTEYRPVDLLCQCIEQFKDWMCQHFLQLNKDKTEIIVFVCKDKRLNVSLHLDALSLKTKTKPDILVLLWIQI
jgi:hypothetical protein